MNCARDDVFWRLVCEGDSAESAARRTGPVMPRPTAMVMKATATMTDAVLVCDLTNTMTQRHNVVVCKHGQRMTEVDGQQSLAKGRTGSRSRLVRALVYQFLGRHDANPIKLNSIAKHATHAVRIAAWNHKR